MVHVPAKFRENTSRHFWVTVRKLNVTDRQTDRRTDRGRCNISRPGPSAPREIIKNRSLWVAYAKINDIPDILQKFTLSSKSKYQWQNCIEKYDLSQIYTRYKRCSQRKRRVANWFDNCCHCFVVKVYPINVTQAHWHISHNGMSVQ